MDVVVVRSEQEAAPLLAGWQRLAAAALEQNPFYEPWMLLPALRHLGGASVRVAFVVEQEAGELNVLGVFPFEELRGFRGLPFVVYRSWKHPHCGLCTPLISATRADEVLGTMVRWFQSLKTKRASLLEFPMVAADGAFRGVLTRVVNSSGIYSVLREAHSRAVYRSTPDVDDYLRSVLMRKKRKELARLRRRLAEQGNMHVEQLQPTDDLKSWVTRFLGLERSGWKGEAGTALACSKSERSYFEEITRGAFQQNRLMMLSLKLGEVPIAMKCNFIGDPISYAFKIAFNEAYAEYSPGVLLEISTMDIFGKAFPHGTLDSCAEAEHPMIERIWKERRTMESHLLSLGGISAQALVKWILPAKQLLWRSGDPEPRVEYPNREGEVNHANQA